HGRRKNVQEHPDGVPADGQHHAPCILAPNRWRYRWARTIQTCPGAKVIRWPDIGVNVVPPPSLGRDQWAVHAWPSRRTRAVPDPVVCAYGGGWRSAKTRSVCRRLYWITPVAGDSLRPSVVPVRAPSIDSSQRSLAADQEKRNEAAG